MSPDCGGADERGRALACVGAAIAIGAPAQTLHRLVDEARDLGATVDEIIGTLVAVAPIVGSVRLVKAASEVAQAVGYDIDRALEGTD